MSLNLPLKYVIFLLHKIWLAPVCSFVSLTAVFKAMRGANLIGHD